MRLDGRPRPAFRERHFDYAMRPTEYPQLLSIAAGQKVTVPFTFQDDAPFLLRSRAVRVPYSVVCGGSPVPTSVLSGLRMRFTDATTEFRAQDYIRQLCQMSYYGQWGNPLPVYPEILYPAGSTMQVDLFNDGATAITNLTLYWRGVKLFPWGQRIDTTYPAKFSQLDYTYTIAQPSDTNPLGQILSVPIKANITNQVFKLQDDADFVIRSGQAGIPFGAIFEVFFQLYDADKYPYSNFPIHADVLFGNMTTEQLFTYGNGAASAAPYLTGPIAPGLFFPEIYLQKTRIMYYDLIRDDSAIPCAAVVNYPVLLSGAKVFPQQ